MPAMWRILLGFLIWALVFGPGSPLGTSHTLFFSSQASADTNVWQVGADGGYGQNGGNVDLEDVASGSDYDLYLNQSGFGGTGGYGDNSLAPGKGGLARSVLKGLSLGTSSTSYGVNATGGQGGWGLAGSAANGGSGRRGPGGLLFQRSGRYVRHCQRLWRQRRHCLRQRPWRRRRQRHCLLQRHRCKLRRYYGKCLGWQRRLGDEWRQRGTGRYGHRRSPGHQFC